MLTQKESDDKEETRTGKVLLLFQSSMKGENEGKELVFVKYMECAPLLGEVSETLGGGVCSGRLRAPWKKCIMCERR